MFHLGRCGSTVLGQMLNQHPQIHWAGEIFEDYKTGRLPRAERMIPPMWTLRGQMARCAEPIFGLETVIIPGQELGPTLNQSLAEHVQALQALGYKHFIELRRENHLRKVVSGHVGKQRGKFHRRVGEPVELQTVRVEVDRGPFTRTVAPLLERFQMFEAAYARVRELVPGETLLSLAYERDIAPDPHIAYRKVCAFLALPDHPVEITHARSNPFPLRDVIENWSEVEDALAGTEYEWMLSED